MKEIEKLKDRIKELEKQLKEFQGLPVNCPYWKMCRERAIEGYEPEPRYYR